MIRPIYWILLVIAGILSVTLLVSGISVRTSEQTVYSVSNIDAMAVIKSALKDNETISKNELTIIDAQYINDSIAVIKANTNDGQRINFLLEYYNDTLFLTNYSTRHFTAEELNNPLLLNYINNAIDA